MLTEVRQLLVYKSKKLIQHLKPSSEEPKKEKQPQGDDKELKLSPHALQSANFWEVSVLLAPLCSCVFSRKFEQRNSRWGTASHCVHPLAEHGPAWLHCLCWYSHLS